MRPTRVLLVVAALLTAAGLARADAATIGGVSGQSLDAFSAVGGTGAPTVLTWANFDGTTGTNLNGLALNGPGTWSVDGSGTWTIQTNKAATTSAAVANLWVSTGNANATAVATFTFGGTARAGLSVRGSSTRLFYALYSKASGGTIQLYKRSGGTTLIGSATGVGLPASATMSVDARTDTIRVFFAGTEYVTYTLSGSELGQFGGNDRFGVMADSDSVTRFDDFHVDA